MAATKTHNPGAKQETEEAGLRGARPASGRRPSPRPATRWICKRDVFKLDDPKKIAASLKRSAERSHRRKSAPYRSAMSMLTFYVNRAGHNLPAKRKRMLERAKDELRKAFGKEA